ncbi:hypothetical protein [Caecibacteroides pullorum]|uniref:Uncharacterized protein n=1 Tax=Caecibacteroides pullorum TaxID=2725562 RepID=A0AA40ZSB2_9BACT|nr:hypothetical protein [Caecibacteroides pullorum]MBM6856629.1 hypothetical protein [Caecibacteroides pullorum]MBV8057635.1 hypothetical protein [Caecibacteroides pullorum]
MAEAYSMISVPRKNNNAGRASGKKSYIIIFRWDDIKTFAKDEKGVKVTAFDFQEGKKPVAVYATDSTINIYHTAEGDDDARGFIHHVDFDHPGSEVEWDEFVNNNVNENLGAIVINCSGDDCKIAGTPCTPLKMSTAEGQDNNEANKTTVNLASSLRGDTLGRIAKSLIPATDNEEINAILGLPPAAESSQGGGV